MADVTGHPTYPKAQVGTAVQGAVNMGASKVTVVKVGDDEYAVIVED